MLPGQGGEGPATGSRGLTRRPSPLDRRPRFPSEQMETSEKCEATNPLHPFCVGLLGRQTVVNSSRQLPGCFAKRIQNTKNPSVLSCQSLRHPSSRIGKQVPGLRGLGPPALPAACTSTRPSLASGQDSGQVRGTWAPQGEGRRAEKFGRGPSVNRGRAETSHRVPMVRPSLLLEAHWHFKSSGSSVRHGSEIGPGLGFPI